MATGINYILHDCVESMYGFLQSHQPSLQYQILNLTVNQIGLAIIITLDTKKPFDRY